MHDIGIIHKRLSTKMIFMNNGKVKISNPAFLELNLDVSSSISLQREIMFLDPEVINHKNSELTSASDIYSLGVIMWTISNGKLPFEGITDQTTLVNRIVFKNMRERPDNNISPAYNDLYQKCWDFDRSKRPDTDVVCKQLEVMLQEFQEEQNPDLILDASEISQQDPENSRQKNNGSELPDENEIGHQEVSYNKKRSGFMNMLKIKCTRKSKKMSTEKFTKTSDRKFPEKKSLFNHLKETFTKKSKKASGKAPEKASETAPEKASEKAVKTT